MGKTGDNQPLFLEDSLEMNSHHAIDTDRGNEISLFDIVNFLIAEWRRILGAAVTVMAFAVGGVFLFGSHKAIGLIINTSPSASNTHGNNVFDFVQWKYFQKALPDLASELVHSGQIKPDEEKLFQLMSRPEWWDKNVTPVLALSKSDNKLLGNISNEMQNSSGTAIHYLQVTGIGDTKAAAEKNASASIDFIRSGSTYLSLKGLVIEADAATAKADAQLREQILSAELEMKFLERKSQNLDLLRKRFPGNSTSPGTAFAQVLDPKDAVAKYLPLDTQLVAINEDMYNLQESLTRLKNTQVKHAALRKFVEVATPAVTKNTDGPRLGDELLKIVAELRKAAPGEDLVRQQAVTELESSIRSVLTTFSGLQNSFMPQTRRATKLPLVGTLGFLLGGMGMLVFVLIQRTLGRAQNDASDNSMVSPTGVRLVEPEPPHGPVPAKSSDFRDQMVIRSST